MLRKRSKSDNVVTSKSPQSQNYDSDESQNDRGCFTFICTRRKTVSEGDTGNINHKRQEIPLPSTPKSLEDQQYVSHATNNSTNTSSIPLDRIPSYNSESGADTDNKEYVILDLHTYENLSHQGTEPIYENKSSQNIQQSEITTPTIYYAELDLAPTAHNFKKNTGDSVEYLDVDPYATPALSVVMDEPVKQNTQLANPVETCLNKSLCILQ